MRTVKIFAIALMVSVGAQAWGVGNGNDDSGDSPVGKSHSESMAVVTVDSNAGAHAESVATGTGGEGGAASSVAAGGSSTADVDVSVSTQHKRAAPGIAMSHPMATMDCIRGFGLGGSNTRGSLILGPQWKDQDCVALQQFVTLNGLGLAVAAARAYCARPRFSKPFDSRVACESEIARSLTAETVVIERVVEVVDTRCETKLERCESVTGKSVALETKK